jgi:hypothetical protein
MRFFDRKEEIAELRKNRELSTESSRFTVLTGRRRVGKTELLHEAFSDMPYIYFYVSRKALVDLCEDFRQITEKALGRTIPGEIRRFSQIFRFIMEESANRPITLVIDEFQDFLAVDESVFSEMARDWDELHRKARINLVVSGSINRLMARIFENREAPLYGRNTGRIRLEPFRISVLKHILSHYNRSWTNEDLLALWTFTGGVARYVALLMDAKAWTKKTMMREIIRENSSFFDEGKIVLIEEFGREHGTYFSILSAIAGGKTSRDKIESVVGGAVGGYLTKLEREYDFIGKKQPLFERSERKNCLYKIDDNFYRFWFRFIFKYNYLLEVKMFDELRGIVERDYDVFSGIALEGYFAAKFVEERRYSRLGGWWNRKGEQEIDLVCENEFTNELAFYEIKRDKRRIDIALLNEKAQAFLEKNPSLRGHVQKSCGLSIDDM